MTKVDKTTFSKGRVVIEEDGIVVIDMDADKWLQEQEKKDLATPGCPPFMECWMCPKNRGVRSCLP